MSEAMIDLDALLRHRAEQLTAGNKVWIEGAWVQRTPTVPTDGGAQMVVSFAERTWRYYLQLQRDACKADHFLAQAELALANLIELGLDKDVAIALAAVQRARELL